MAVPREISNRDAGLTLISRVNRWMIAGAVGLTGLISVAAANAFHGRTTHSTSAHSAPAQQQSAPAQQAPASSDDGGLQAPAQAPAPAPAAPAAPAVSGGS